MLNFLMDELQKTNLADDSILVLTDANVMFDNKTIHELTRPFQNEKVGVVAAQVAHLNSEGSGIAEQERHYIGRENRIKINEGLLWGAMMGAFGACFALRLKDWSNIPPNTIVDDFFLTMSIIEKGKSAVVNPKAICYEDLPESIDIEFRRKLRISIGNYQNLSRFWRMLFSVRWGVAFSFFSHKVLRWFTPFFLILGLISILYLSFSSQLFAYALIFILFCLALVLLDLIIFRSGIVFKPIRYLTYFFSMNLALLLGFFKFLGTESKGIWEPTERNVQ